NAALLDPGFGLTARGEAGAGHDLGDAFAGNVFLGLVGHDGRLIADLMAAVPPAPSFMQLALEEARAAAGRGEVPVGCVIVRQGEVVARAGNRTLAEKDPTAHAELIAIRAAAVAVGSERLIDCDLYVTLEPCTMCAAAMSFARMRRL